ncbi:glycosyltransferase family 2 protein [Flammeovirga aprica]|uniref:Glycosyltransferase family 2 protein n=1 Tax=Flammeovirga aprica JL-4 TaxID=694437 RepID=A0A7X9P368_9BACT|nr:glycosyltransferase family 2 protein [Flammeovirga aprica]NME68167.1 glycosyltransferase family 2 protein [Flammeovirga aprica JL-4]
MLLDILIPTFNRGEDLLFNLNLLSDYISKIEHSNEIQIIISDNCSDDNTEQLVSTFKHNNPSLSIQYFRNSENIGLERNAVEVLSKSSAEYIMWLGDDDYLPNGYLAFILKHIRDEELGFILPRNINIVGRNEFETFASENPTYETKKAGYQSMYEIGHFSHQMSGIVLRRENLLDKYLEKDNWRNVYLFMFFTNYCILNYNGIFVEDYKVSITQGNSKAWSYDKAGLLPEVYKSYYYFIEALGEEKVSNLIFDFTRRHTWRFGIQIFKPFSSFNRLNFLLYQTSDIDNIKNRLRKLFIKDYIYRIIQ